MKYVPKEALAPCFGLARPSLGIAYVRDDLPARVQAFVTDHELYHLTDPAVNWIWREIKANVHAFVRHPLGGLGCVALTVCSGERWRLYWTRLREGK
ncbi:MAG TPA: hypothetical protein DCS11_05810 [Syntrophus sp. (in: bacteria)]|nr:hypothetical protein [Syntrophus sp. (in: bacteria)]